MRKIDRTGEIRTMNCGEEAKIIRYNSTRDIDIMFIRTGEVIKNVGYSNFIRGNIKSIYTKSVYGVGFIGDSTAYNNDGSLKRSYDVWHSMLRRCYDEKHRFRTMTYEECIVCDEWHCFATFEKWYNENYYEVRNENMQLDKDLLGNSKIYSPKTCVFIPKKINCLILNRQRDRGDYPIGVNYKPSINKYQSRCSNGSGKMIYLGVYDTPEEAFLAYKKFKESYIKEVADEYKNYIPIKVYKALYSYEVNITD